MHPLRRVNSIQHACRIQVLNSELVIYKFVKFLFLRLLAITDTSLSLNPALQQHLHS